MYELYTWLISAGNGLHIGSVFMGVIGYADDMLLLAATIYSLNKMLKTCEDFGRDFDVCYNPTKSKCIVFCEHKRTDVTACMYNSVIPRVQEINYLGNTISANCSDGADVLEKRADINSRANSFVHRF